jgi:hypothetical protein
MVKTGPAQNSLTRNKEGWGSYHSEMDRQIQEAKQGLAWQNQAE